MQLLFLERLNANKIDLPDFSRVTFVNIEVDRNPITFEGRHRRCDYNPVLAASQVLTLQLLLGFFEQTSIERPGNGEARILQAFEQHVFLELNQADKIDLCDSRPLFHCYHNNIAINFDAHILEESGSKQSLDRLRRLIIVHYIADLDREITKHRSSFCSLYTIDANIHDGKRFEGGCARCKKRGNHTRKQVFLHKLSRKSIG